MHNHSQHNAVSFNWGADGKALLHLKAFWK